MGETGWRLGKIQRRLPVPAMPALVCPGDAASTSELVAVTYGHATPRLQPAEHANLPLAPASLARDLLLSYWLAILAGKQPAHQRRDNVECFKVGLGLFDGWHLVWGECGINELMVSQSLLEAFKLR